MLNLIKRIWTAGGLFPPLLMVFAGLMLVAHSMGYISRTDAIGTYRLDLTADGCRYAKAIHLKVVEADTCSVTARFSRFAITPGGRIYNDDGSITEVTAAMLLGSTEVKTDMPPTAAEIADRRQGYTEAGLGFAFMIVALFLMHARTSSLKNKRRTT